MSVFRPRKARAMEHEAGSPSIRGPESMLASRSVRPEEDPFGNWTSPGARASKRHSQAPKAHCTLMHKRFRVIKSIVRLTSAWSRSETRPHT